MRAGDAHIFAILGYGTACYLDALRLQNSCKLLVGERARGILFVDQLFYAALQDEKACVAAFGSLHALAKK